MKILTSILLSFGVLFSAQTIEMSVKQQDDLGVKLQTVSKIESMTLGPYNGVVSLDKRDIISISSNVESVVKDIYVRKFQAVKKGDKLLGFASNELLNLQKEYIEALIESKNINENYERNLKLKAQGIISQKKLLVSKKEKQSSDLHVKLSANFLLASGLNNYLLKKVKRTHMPIMQINILAPRDGVIYEIAANIGEVVNSDKSMLKMYGDGKRYIEITIPVKKIETISIGDKCSFSSYRARILTIGNMVNTKSQSVEVRAEIQNSDGILINRVYEVNISENISDAVKVKKSAMVYRDNKPYLFKKVDAGFKVIDVKVMSEGPTCYIIKADLKEGDKIAISSTSALLSAMEDGDE